MDNKKLHDAAKYIESIVSSLKYGGGDASTSPYTIFDEDYHQYLNQLGNDILIRNIEVSGEVKNEIQRLILIKIEKFRLDIECDSSLNQYEKQDVFDIKKDSLQRGFEYLFNPKKIIPHIDYINAKEKISDCLPELITSSIQKDVKSFLTLSKEEIDKKSEIERISKIFRDKRHQYFFIQSFFLDFLLSYFL